MFQANAFQVDSFQIASEPALAPIVQQPAAGGGAMLGRRAGSGRWHRVDSGVVTLHARPARSCIAVSDTTTVVGFCHTVDIKAEAARTDIAASAVASSVGLVPVLAVVACRTGLDTISRTRPVKLVRDDTAEVMRLMGMLAKARKPAPRLTPAHARAMPGSGDLADVLALIDRYKQKTDA